MGKQKKPEERTLKPGSQYHTIYTHILLHPGIELQELTDQLEPTLHLSSGEISKRCARLSLRGYLKKKLVTVKRPRGQYATEVRWYTTEMAPEDSLTAGMQDHLWRPDVAETKLKAYEINCFKVEDLMKIFNHKCFSATCSGSARDLAKHELKLIDSVYDSVFQVDVDMTVRLTYFPVLNTIEDQYEYVFELYFHTQMVGHLTKVKYDPENITFWFYFRNKSLGIRFTSIAYASRMWQKSKKQLADKYERILEEDMFSLEDLLD